MLPLQTSSIRADASRSSHALQFFSCTATCRPPLPLEFRSCYQSSQFTGILPLRFCDAEWASSTRRHTDSLHPTSTLGPHTTPAKSCGLAHHGSRRRFQRTTVPLSVHSIQFLRMDPIRPSSQPATVPQTEGARARLTRASSGSVLAASIPVSQHQERFRQDPVIRPSQPFQLGA